MKLSKFILAAAAAFGLCMLSCQKPVVDEDPHKDSGLYFVQDGPVMCDNTKQDFVIDVYTEVGKPDVQIYFNQENDGWLRARFQNGGLKVWLHRNTSLEERSARIILMAPDVEPASIQIVQAAATSEGDPWEPEDESFYAFNWNNNWSVYDWLIDQAGITYKYEPLAYGRQELDYCDAGCYVYESSGKFTVGLRISEELLAVCGGQQLTQLGMISEPGMVESFEYAIVTLMPSEDNADTPEWKKGKCVDIDRIIWRSDKVTPNDGGWYLLDRTEQLDGAVFPESGDVMILAFVEGDGSVVPKQEWHTSMLWMRNQPVNKFAPTYIADDNSEGVGMQLCKVGSVSLNFTFTQKTSAGE